MCLGDEKKWILTGLSSYGFGCGSNLPGVYTNITYFYRWIKLETSSSNSLSSINPIQMFFLAFLSVFFLTFLNDCL